MGKRAKKAPVVTKKRAVLAKRFKCPFCANDNVVECKMDHRNGTGSLACRLCGASYQMPIHHLHEPIDVFSEWLDDCEAAEKGASGGGGGAAGGGGADRDKSNGGMGDYSDVEEDDSLGEPSGLGKAKEKKGVEEEAEKNNFASLGLDDSDSDDD